jgi:hypothetical protein
MCSSGPVVRTPSDLRLDGMRDAASSLPVLLASFAYVALLALPVESRGQPCTVESPHAKLSILRIYEPALPLHARRTKIDFASEAAGTRTRPRGALRIAVALTPAENSQIRAVHEKIVRDVERRREVRVRIPVGAAFHWHLHSHLHLQPSASS